MTARRRNPPPSPELVGRRRTWSRKGNHTRALTKTLSAFEAFRVAVAAGDPVAMVATWTRYRESVVILNRFAEQLVG